MRWRVLACSLALTLACATQPVFAAAPANQAEWTQAVQRRMISSFKFPPEAQRLSGPISLSLKIIVRRDGSIADVSVDRSSGDAAVDRAATRMVQRAGPLPAFSADMTGEKTALSLPLRFQQEEDEPAGDRADDRGPPADIAPRRYADAASGLTVTVPSPLRVRPAPARGRFDALIEISSPDGFPPRAQDAKYLCRVGFVAAPPLARGAKAPAAPTWQAQVKAAERRQRQRRASIELYDHYTLAGSAGIDYVAAPGAGPGHADTLEYYAELPLPQGRVRMACATQRDAMPAAMTMFRQVRDGIRIAPR